jgi:hypothetical protein
VFDTGTAKIIDRGTKFLIGNEIYSLKLAQEGGLQILPVGSSRTAGLNQAVLRQASENVYESFWVVEGTPEAGEEPEDGESVSADREIEGFVSAFTASAFSESTPEQRLSELAKKTRIAAYSASMTARGPARRLLLKEFPSLTGVSPVLSGDEEMLRDTVNPLGVASSAMDVFVKSSSYGARRQAVVRLAYYPVQGAQPSSVFAGKLDLPGNVVYIHAINAVAAPDADLGLRSGGATIFSKSLDTARAPMASCAYSALEELYIGIPMPLDPSTGDPMIVPGVYLDGNQYSDFIVDYSIDPAREAVAAYVESPETAPIGVDVLVRSPIPIVISSLQICYVKASGTTMNLTTARKEIAQYLQSLCGSENSYSDSRIFDIMHWAGARDVRRITSQARIAWSVASRYLDVGGTLPSENFLTALSESSESRQVSIPYSSGFFASYADPFIGTENATYESAGLRNLCFLVTEAEIGFVEDL